MKATGYFLWINDELSWFPTLANAERWAHMARVFGYDIIIRGIDTGFMLYPVATPSRSGRATKRGKNLRMRRAA